MRSGSPSLERPGLGAEGAVPLGRTRAPKAKPRPVSPSILAASPARTLKASKTSPHASPNMAARGPVNEGPPSLELPPAIEQLAATAANNKVAAAGKLPTLAPVPAAPTPRRHNSLVCDATSIGADEAFSNDERQLNNFLKLHPMLSLEATSQRTLQLLSSMFEKVTLKSVQLPVVTKQHDDKFLTSACEAIGERPCVNGERCLARFIAQVRYGVDTKMAFTCKEFLLPQQYEEFKAGGGLPLRRGKCLLCTRYFTNYVYILARSDPSFKVGQTPLGVQIFSNAVTHVPGSPAEGDEEDLQQAAAELPYSTCSVSKTDGYHPSATLFVDEDWMALRSAREGRLGQMLFKPVVRFCSTHYKYVKDSDGLRIVQVGIGADAKNNGLHFQELSAGKAAPPGASPRPTVVPLH